MGSVYAEFVLGISTPRVGLLNIGEEETKGSQLVLDAYPQLRGKQGLNFIGNVEGRDILSGKADVIACDGFVGNVVLKFAEGMAKTLFGMIKESVNSNLKAKIGGMLVRDALGTIKSRFDYTEYGGAPLLGVQGICIISHGSSNAKAVKNAVRAAKEAVERQLVERIAGKLSD
jgi:glycerol-3-phosphate acyltransferase PlsX